MFASFQKKYFLSDKGVAGVKRGIFWTAITNLVTMAGMGFLFLTMACFVEHLTTGAALPAVLPVVAGLVVFLVAALRLELAAVLLYLLHFLRGVRQPAHRNRRAPAQAAPFVLRPPRPGRPYRDYHGRRPGHGACLQPCSGRAVRRRISRCAIVFGRGRCSSDWQAGRRGVLERARGVCASCIASRGPMTPVFDASPRRGRFKVTEAVQEALDCVREMRATNQEEHYLEGFGRRDRPRRSASVNPRRARQRASASTPPLPCYAWESPPRWPRAPRWSSPVRSASWRCSAFLLSGEPYLCAL